MEFVASLAQVTAGTALDVLPIVAILFGFQAVVVRKKPANLKRIIIGFIYCQSCLIAAI